MCSPVKSAQHFSNLSSQAKSQQIVRFRLSSVVLLSTALQQLVKPSQIAVAATCARSRRFRLQVRAEQLQLCRRFHSTLELNLCFFYTEKMVGLSKVEKQFIHDGIAQDVRCDGRQRLHFRPFSVQTGVIPQANGSARLRLGATEVIVSVKAELGRPSTFQPDKGTVSIFVACSPTAAPVFEGKGGEDLSSELSTDLQRCLLGGKSGAGAAFDLSSLKVLEGKICWDLYIDALVVSSDGNLLDTLGAAIRVALINTGIPRVVNVQLGPTPEDQPEVDVSDEFVQFDASGVPVLVTLTKVGKHYIVDATTEEESQMSSAVTISVNRHGICGLTKRGGAGLHPSVIMDMISVAKHVSEQLMTTLDAEIAAAEASAGV